MPTVDSLPGDQRAVLQLVLGRGRSYDEIARLLSIDRARVRERAVAALEALGPQTDVSPEHRALITDYLLEQLPDELTPEARSLLATSPPERAWARVVSSELAPLAGDRLPEIPFETPPAGAEPAATPPSPAPADDAEAAAAPPEPAPFEPVPAEPAPFEPTSEPEPETIATGRATPAPVGAAPDTEAEADPGRGRRRRGRDNRGGGPRTSRLGGALLIAAAVVIVAVVLYFALRSSGPSSHPKAAAQSTTTTSSTTSTTPTTSTTSTSSSAARVVAQINLTPPPGSKSKAAGIAQILREGTTDGIAIAADNLAANATAPHPNAYAVWLYNSPHDAHILGFVNPGVGANGRLSTAGGLPANASHYKKLVITLETNAQPKTPGPIILEGPLTGV